MRIPLVLSLAFVPSVASAQLTFPTTPPEPVSPATTSPSTLASVPAAAPAAAAPLPSVSFEVKVMRSGGATDLQQGSSGSGLGARTGTSVNTLDRTKLSQLDLEVSLRNFANRADTVTVEWAFFSTPVGGSANTVLLFNEGSQEITFKPGGTEKVRAASGNAVSVDSRRSETTRTSGSSSSDPVTVSYGNSVSKTGQKVAGWLVRVRAGEKLLGFKASTPRFEAYGRDPVALAALPRGNTIRPTPPSSGSSPLLPPAIPTRPSRN